MGMTGANVLLVTLLPRSNTLDRFKRLATMH